MNGNWRKIPIALTDAGFGEQTAHTGENACFRQPSDSHGLPFRLPSHQQTEEAL